ncbi:hypothetical protein CAEBREN_23549 [Caenorhabditis brenneri]|uniref:Uncharacterized protein n=1 Tax=Caenorhabditis brenneri TaxID=135651 RepID=G0MEI3_CAEBE|nr:hypothetical protein CAEBREN_23549 [Caenorhabditis brenneri]
MNHENVKLSDLIPDQLPARIPIPDRYSPIRHYDDSDHESENKKSPSSVDEGDAEEWKRGDEESSSQVAKAGSVLTEKHNNVISQKRRILSGKEAAEHSRKRWADNNERCKREVDNDSGVDASLSIEKEDRRVYINSPEQEVYRAEEQAQDREIDPTSRTTHGVVNVELIRYDQARTLYENGLLLIERYQNSKKAKRSAKRSAMCRIAQQSGNPKAVLNYEENEKENESMDETIDDPEETSMMDLEEITEDENDFQGEEAEEEIVEEEDDEVVQAIVQEHHKDCMEAVEKLIFPENTNDPAHDYFISFLGEKVQLLEVILNKYQTFQDTMDLDPSNALEHWSRERLSQDEHNSRFTRWDAAMANAVLKQTIDEMNLYKTNAYVFRKQNKQEYCATRAMKIERIIHEPLKHDKTVFCALQFGLNDIAEKKTSTKDRLLFQKSILAYKRLKKDFLKKKLRSVNRALKKQDISWKIEKEELFAMCGEDYRLPRGKIFCRLILNIAELFVYYVYDKKFQFGMQGNWDAKKLFKGVPFNEDGSRFLL